MIRTLTAADFESLYAAFTAAFSDYVVPLVLTREQLAEMFARRGWVPELSVGAFDGDRMMAFTVNCVEGDRAYDSGTGVVPDCRGWGLGQDLMESSFQLLRGRCREYVLEVIDGNERALELYLATGFTVRRGLQCWGYESQSLKVSESQRESLRLCDFETLRLWSDVEPSWQNSEGSIQRSTQPHVVLGDEDGYAIVFPDRGDLAQLAVRREARRRGVGTRLLEAAAAVAGKPLRIMNVDERDLGIASFLERNGAQRTVRQLEMIRPLD